MRSGWVVVLLLLVGVNLHAAGAPRLSAALDEGRRAVITPELSIELLVRPHPGDAGTRLARRVTSDASRWSEIEKHNALSGQLRTDRDIRVPLEVLRPELQREALRALFPKDTISPNGWSHGVVLDLKGEGESLWSIAEWFTGDGANYRSILDASGLKALSTKRGDVVLIPQSLLRPALRSASLAARAEKKNSTADERTVVATKQKAKPDASKQDEVLITPPGIALAESPAPAESLTVKATPTSESTESPLTFEERDGMTYGVYRLKKGEALYSAVAVRFTGRVFAKDVNEAVARIVEASDISDVARIAVNKPVRIPLDLLTAEYLPTTDTRRVAYEESQRAIARAVRRVEAKDLRGIRIILDAGHGGRDVGATHDDLWESTYVYDVMCRLKAVIEKKSDAKVTVTTRSSGGDYAPSSSDIPRNRTDHIVLTDPEYALEDAVVGVNLRWYLANSWYNRAIAASVAPEKVVFISIHADSLHPSLRGAMAYIPGEQYSTGSFKKSGKVYLARAEVRENPVVSQSSDEALRAEGLSRELAEAIIGAFAEAELPVHPFKPVREHVVRDGKEWVPAIIRYNKVPTRLLLEICNLGNEEDRKLIKTRKYRQALADAIYAGLNDFFDGRQPQAPATTLRASAR